MTLFIDKLIKLGLVERLPDVSDRRIINISLTEKGKLVLDDARVLIADNIRQKLSGLSDEEVKELALSLRRLRDIGSKIG
jgi:DNA-binding MarR family transcriptional regulator